MFEAIEEFLEKNDWKYFEDFIKTIFETHNFKVKKHVRFKGKKKREIDILAWNDFFVFIIECKRWKKHRYKVYQLKKACEKLENIKEEFENCTLSSFSELAKKRKIIPLIITLFEEDISFYQNVCVVPIYKLNYFILNVENILENLHSYK